MLSCLKLHPYCKVKLNSCRILLPKISSSAERLQKLSEFCSRTFMAPSSQSAGDRVSRLSRYAVCCYRPGKSAHASNQKSP